VTAFLYGALLAVGLTLLVATAVRVLVGGIAGPPERTAGDQESRGSARRILDERYAAGELTTEEYQHRLDVLEGRN
jgi:putative membrane protein